nr:ATP-binding protein [Pedobacter panaciterrae]
MILNTADNGKIINSNLDIHLNDFTVLTGENGSGKTQLLEFIRDYAGGFGQYNDMGEAQLDDEGNLKQLKYPLVNETGQPLTEIIYSYPGLRNSLYEYEGHQQPLIETIKQQWHNLEPLAIAFRSIKHKSFTDEGSELAELQTALNRFITSATQVNTHNPPQAKPVGAHQLQQLKKLSENCGKDIDDLYLIDFIIFYPIPLGLFSSALDLLFHQFFLKTMHYPKLTQGMTSPLVVFNEILDRASFKYKAEYMVSQNIEYPLPVKLIDRKSGKEVDFQNLSSGETTVLALIFALYNSENKGHFPQVILFDEPDAHLHPSLTQIFLEVIREVLVKEQNVKVILTTHSPSTVALASEESVYCMDRDLGCPVKEDKRTAINLLSSGLASLTIEESSLGINYNIQKANTNILFTEGITDKINLETAWDKLYPGKPRNFYIQDCFSASFLGSLFNLGDDVPDGIFHQFDALKMIALFDFDNAGYNNWHREKKFPNLIESDPRKCLTRSNGGNGYLMLLPVPDINEISQQVIISGNETYKEHSYLTIESLFFKNDQLRSYFKTLPLTGGAVAHVINGNTNKKKLSSTLNLLEAEDFFAFKPLFEKIEAIFKN